MTTYFGYSHLVVEDCEDVWTAGDADMTIAQESTIKKVGTYSVKCTVADGASADDVMMYENFTGVDLSAKSYFVAWCYSSIALNAGDVQFGYDEDDSLASVEEWISLPAMTAGKWYRIVFVPTAAASARDSVNCVAFRMHVDKGAFAFYVDDVEAFIGQAFTTATVYGVDKPEGMDSYPGIKHELLDGSRSEIIPVDRRNPVVNLGPVQTAATRLFLYNFRRATDKVIYYSDDEVQVILDSASEPSVERLGDWEYAPAFVFRFNEKTPFTTAPPSWS